ncbi:hypothetical protein CU015_0060 [Enterococcus faecium]|nr:hypothetical protein [Enterococcus faecium]
MHHLIGFMGGLQVDRLVFSSQKQKKTGHSSSLFFVFLFIFSVS